MKELRLTATRENLDRVNAFVEAELEAAECSPRISMQIMVALEEMYVNIASYAYEPETGDALIQVGPDNGILKVVLTDWGQAFNPLDRDDPDVTLSAEERKIGGLGIFMVKKSMDVFEYQRLDDRNVVTIGKRIG